MTGRELVNEFLELNPEQVLPIIDGFDDAILGLVRRCGELTYVAYDVDKVIEILMGEPHNMSYDDAWEFHEFNQADLYIKNVWCFVKTPDPDVPGQDHDPGILKSRIGADSPKAKIAGTAGQTAEPRQDQDGDAEAPRKGPSAG